MFCPSCGKATRNGSVYCSHCGAPLYTSSDHAQIWGAFANFLAKASLRMAKGMTVVLIGGLAGTCGLAAIAALSLAGYLLYQFAKGLTVIVPWFLAGTLPVVSIGGVPLLLSGLTGLLVALLLGMAAAAMIRCLQTGMRSIKKIRKV